MYPKIVENTNEPGEDAYILPKEQKKRIGGCDVLKIVAALLFITIVILSLAYCGVFDKQSSSEGTEEESEVYLTGPVAPNMMFLLADDIGWSDISANGGRFDTPNIDELVTGGIQLTNFYSQALCTPSRMAFLTGRFAWKLGVQYPEVIHGLMTGHIPEDSKTFAEITREMGYDNYYVGRWGVGYASWEFTPLGRGWDNFMGYFGPEGGYYNHTTDHFEEWIGVYDMWDMTTPHIDANMTYSEDLFYERTLFYLEEAKKNGKPFTLTYSAQTAHAPIDDDWPTFYPPTTWDECEEEEDLYRGREYYCNKVKYLDYTWGLLLDYLKDTGMWDNMIVFVTTDNGALPYTAQDVYSDWGCNWPLRGGKVTHFEGGIKVWAGLTGGLVPDEYQGTTFDSLTHITDFATTAMRLSMTQKQYETRETLTGTSKVPDGKNIFSLEHHDLIIHNVLPSYIPSWVNDEAFDYAATDGEWKYMVGTDDSSAQGHGWYNFPGYGIIDETNDPVTYANAGGNCSSGCLFHLLTDPYEYRDLSADYPDIAFYFYDVINGIYTGGLDDSYHSGQPYEADYRGWMSDNILRPYLSNEAIKDYHERVSSVESADEYDYVNSPLSYISDYGKLKSPFDFFRK